MSIFDKIKLLFRIQGPITEISKEVAEAKKTKKWVHFAVTVLGTLATTAASLSGFIPPQVQLIAATLLQTLYNVMRGLDKTDDTEVKGIMRTTEFWTSALTAVQTGLVQAHAGGIDPKWIEAAIATVGASLAAAQNLAGRGLNNEEENS